MSRWVSKVTFDSKANQVTSDSYLTWKSLEDGYIQFNISYNSLVHTEIAFVHEGILMTIKENVRIELFDREQKLVASLDVAPEINGRGRYFDISCKVEEGKIWFRFPYYRWVDNYPHCDGENDRWDAYVEGFREPYTFDLKTCEIMEKKE